LPEPRLLKGFKNEIATASAWNLFLKIASVQAGRQWWDSHL